MKQKYVHFDGNPPLLPGAAAAEPVPPYVYVVNERALRAKTVALAAKRFVDMLYVTGLDLETATRHFRPLPAGLTEGLYDNRDHSAFTAAVESAWRSGAIRVRADDRTRTVEASWTDPGFGPAIAGRAVAHPGYGGIVLGEHDAPAFDPAPVKRAGARRDAALFLDMDLAILGAAPAAFDAYEQAVRREYGWVADPAWRAGRAAVLKTFLARPHIFHTREFRDCFERQARENMTRSLAVLDAGQVP